MSINFFQKSLRLPMIIGAALSTAPILYASSTLAAPGDNVRMFKIPSSYTVGTATFNNLNGYVINIEDTTLMNAFIPDLKDKEVRCEMITDSNDSYGNSLRQNCLTLRNANQQQQNCSELYSDLYHDYPGMDAKVFIEDDRNTDLVPVQPVSYWVTTEGG